MLDCSQFYNLIKSNGIDFFSGVPDSLLKNICDYITDNTPSEKNIITANEGGAIALATGYHLATGKVGLVYMQNSGQGNVINPLLSLADSEVYSIPILLMIGWRGEPGEKDEPQHIKQGKVTIPLLETLKIPYEILPKKIIEAKKVLEKAVHFMKNQNSVYALVVRKGTFKDYLLKKKPQTCYKLFREEAIKIIVDNLGDKDIIVSTTGMTSRELFEYREKKGLGHEKDFLTVGSMGHASRIALGIALSKPSRQVYCLDGDASAIMHMGALSTIGKVALKNFKHIVINNGSHESTGGQPTAGFIINIAGVAKNCGYKLTLTSQDLGDFKNKLNELKSSDGPSLLEIKVSKGHRDDLGRPNISPIKNKENFMRFLQEN